MEINAQNYRSFPAIANSDLSWYEKQFYPQQRIIDCEQAFKMGTGIDCYITEREKVIENYKTFAIEGVFYTAEEVAIIKEMYRSFYDKKTKEGQFCIDFVKDANFQHISYQPDFEIDYDGMKFEVPAKAKWDIKKKAMKYGGDIKSTTATTMKQCLDALAYFNYDRSRAWYMDLEGHSIDVLIFISKVTFKIFIIPIDRNHWIYKDGKAKYQRLAFEYWKLFINQKIA